MVYWIEKENKLMHTLHIEPEMNVTQIQNQSEQSWNNGVRLWLYTLLLSRTGHQSGWSLADLVAWMDFPVLPAQSEWLSLRLLSCWWSWLCHTDAWLGECKCEIWSDQPCCEPTSILYPKNVQCLQCSWSFYVVSHQKFQSCPTVFIEWLHCYIQLWSLQHRMHHYTGYNGMGYIFLR